MKSAFHHGDLADALLQAASSLIAERASSDFSLRELALGLGVSHAAAYRHFRDKRALLGELATRRFIALDEALAAAADRARPTSTDRLTDMCLAYIDFACANAGAYRILFHPDLCERGDFPALTQAAMAAFARLEQEVAAGQATWSLKAELPAAIIASALWSAVHGYATLFLDRQIDQDDAAGDRPPADKTALIKLLIDSVRR